MHRSGWVLVGAFCCGLVMAATMGQAAEVGPFIGVDLGLSEPHNDNYRAHVKTGATGSPYGGYMFNKYLGLQGQLDFTFQPPDNDGRKNGTGIYGQQNNINNENQTTTMIGGTFGPRLNLPVSELVDLYVTGQGGVFKGLGGRLNQTAPGFSVGGGIDFNVTREVAFSIFGRWNRAYMSPHPTFLVGQEGDQQGPSDIRWATVGVGLKYTFAQPQPPPPPAPAPPPPPVAAPAPPIKKKIVLRAVHFDFNKAVIRADAVPVLNEAVSTLKEEGTVAVIVAGHTDSVGSDSYNMKLSIRRANAVRDYLVNHGIPASRIRTEGFGETKPVASNATADGRAQNRRVELHLD